MWGLDNMNLESCQKMPKELRQRTVHPGELCNEKRLILFF